MGCVKFPRAEKRWVLGLTILVGVVLAACGSSATSTPAPLPTSTPTTPPAGVSAQPTSTSAPTGDTSQPTRTPGPSATRSDPTLTANPTVPPLPTATSPPTPTESPAPSLDPDREIGVVEGVTFVIGEGSESTFTVEEKLSRLPLPSDAVVGTTALSGEVYLDGRPSVIRIALHQLESDQSRRDRYIRDRMFPNHPIATFTLNDARPLPDGFSDGEVVTAEITGQLDIRGVQVPVIFAIEARDDGDVIFILGRTTFVWADFGLTAPNIARFVQVTDEVSVEILLAVRPEAV